MILAADDIALVQPQYLSYLAIFRIAIKAANIIKGNMHPVNKPTRRLSPEIGRASCRERV